MPKRIQRYYNDNPLKEWKRLKNNPVTELEFETTLKYINKYIRPNSQVLDIGAGPGRYSFELAGKGHKITLLDYSSGLVQQARRNLNRQPKKVKENILKIDEASVMDLSKYQDSSFDVVLCLGGVLSHVLKKGDRNKAIIELRRVCKRDGFLFISIIGRLAVLKQEIYYIGQNKKIIEEIKAPLFIKIAKTGDYDGSSGFTACHFFLADEFKQLLTDNGISVTNLIGLEGLNSFLWNESKFLKKDEKAWSNIMKVHELYESFPAAVDSSEHILAVCKNN